MLPRKVDWDLLLAALEGRKKKVKYEVIFSCDQLTWPDRFDFCSVTSFNFKK